MLDSSLNRLEAEIAAPTGNLSIVFTDIKNSTTLWEMHPSAMRSAIKLHNEVMRRQLRRIGGYEVKTEGDAFMVSFPTATSALLWCFAVQLQLLDVAWPSEVLSSLFGQPVYDKDNGLVFRGLSVRMGIHFGDCVSETDPVTRRMDYFGSMVNKASRISSVADGGQITVSSDLISEIQRCLENYQDTDRAASAASDDAAFDESFAAAIRKDLRSLTSQGFEVKEMGEKKLKGLENPEVVYSLYPHALAGRIEHHQQHDRRQARRPRPRLGPLLRPGRPLGPVARQPAPRDAVQQPRGSARPESAVARNGAGGPHEGPPRRGDGAIPRRPYRAPGEPDRDVRLHAGHAPPRQGPRRPA